jgi:gag-polypeptide of LTR copia-type
MILSHACGHMTFENHSATAHAKLAPSEDCEDLCGSCLCEDHFMSVPLVACNLSCSFFIIPNSYIHLYSICVALSVPYRSHLIRLLLDSRRSLPKSIPTQEALSQIALTVSDGVIGHIRNAKTARQAWLKICSVFEQKGLSSQVFLLRKLLNVKLDDGESMQSHINKIRELSDQLEAIGDPVRDRQLAIITLCSLPERYNSVVTSLESRPPEDITFDMIAGRLLAEEERQKESDPGTRSGESAFYSGRFPRKRPPPKCTWCGRVGHIEKNCYDKQGRSYADDTDDKKRGSSQALVGVSQVSEELMF